jgi:hypothetical protein
MHNIHDIKYFLVKMHLYLKCNVKEGTRNTNYKPTQKWHMSCAVLGKKLLPWCP